MTYEAQYIRHAFHPGFIGPAPPPPAPVLLSADSFNRTDSTSNLGSTDGAGTLDPLAWVRPSSTWGILSNHAYVSSLVSRARAYVDLGIANADLQVTITTAAADGGLMFRYVDTSNYWTFYGNGVSNNYTLLKVVAGSTTVIGSTAVQSNNDTLRVVMNGNQIDTYKKTSGGSFVAVLSTTDSFNATATKHGMYADTSANMRWDDWSVYSV